MSGIRFIHAADLHLDSPFAGLKNVPETILHKMKEAPFLAFRKLVDEAIVRKVDFILLAGDLYDGENRSLRTQVRFRKEMERLQEHGIHVYAIHGNHDHLGGKWVAVDLPGNVHVFPGNYAMERFGNGKASVNIYGYSYPVQHVKQRIIDEYRKSGEADYHIGMLHGNLEGSSEHGNYAPFSLGDLLAKDMDYWALGHIHKRSELSLDPPIIYPGNTQGRHRKESGLKGCYYVEFDGKEPSAAFIPTSEIIWEEIEVTVSHEDSFDTILETCRSKMEEIRHDTCGIFLSLSIIHDNSDLSFSDYCDDLLELLAEDEEDQEQFVYPYRAVLKNDSKRMEHNLPIVKDILSREWDAGDVDETLRPLYKHGTGRKYIDGLSEEEKTAMIDDAELLLVELLAIRGDD